MKILEKMNFQAFLDAFTAKTIGPMKKLQRSKSVEIIRTIYCFGLVAKPSSRCKSMAKTHIEQKIELFELQFFRRIILSSSVLQALEIQIFSQILQI